MIRSAALVLALAAALPLSAERTGIAFRTDREIALLAPSPYGPGGELLLYDLRDHAITQRHRLDADSPFSAFALQPSTYHVYTADPFGDVLRYDYPAARIAAVGFADGTVRLVDLRTRVPGEAFLAHLGPVTALDYSTFLPNIRQHFYLASGGEDGAIAVWGGSSTGLQKRMTFDDATVTAVAMHNQRAAVVAGTAIGRLRVVRWTAEELIGDIPAHSGAVTALETDRSGRYILSGGSDGRVRVWNFDNLGLVYDLHAHAGALGEVLVAPDGGTFASVSHDGAVAIWRLDGGQRIGDLAYSGAAVHDVAFDNGTRTLATVSADRVLRLYDIRTRSLVQSLEF